MSDMNWNVRINALRKYVNEYGDAQVPVKYITAVSGYGDIYLGTWVSYLRTRYKDGKLDQDQIVELESFPGWEWSLRPGPQRDEIRDREILKLRRNGNTLQAIGDEYGLSRQRIHQILERVS